MVLSSEQLNFTAMLISLACGYVLWVFSFVGGGDVKLLSVLLLGLGSDDLGVFFLLMSGISLILALATLILRSKNGVPFAPAIVLPYIFVHALF